MKKIFYFTIAAVAMLVFTLESCKKDVPQTTNSNLSTTSNIKNSFESVKNGRLVFKSMAALDSQIVALNGKQEEVYESWQSSINFKSYRTLERKAILTNWNNFYVKKDTLAPEVTFITVPKFFLNILNENREVIVNDSVYFFNGANLCIISSNDETQLKATEKMIDKQLANKNTLTQKSVASNVRYVKLKINTFKSTNQDILKSSYDENSNFSCPEWQTNGASFKFIFEIQWSSDYPTGFGLDVNIENYLVYWHNNHGCWQKAGELCNKNYEVGGLVYKGVYPLTELHGKLYKTDDNSFGGYNFDHVSGVIYGFTMYGTAFNNTTCFTYNPNCQTIMNFASGNDNNGKKL